VGGAPTVRFAPVVPWAKTGPECRLWLEVLEQIYSNSLVLNVKL
jgi:hypothetical protein